MRLLLALGIMVLASGAAEAAEAAAPPYSDFDIISVVPRNPNVKPFVMSVSARERHNAPHRDKLVRLTPTADKD